jgi:hypothetical protein
VKRIQAYVSNQQILAAEMNSLAAASGGDSNNTISAIGTGLDVFPWIYNAAELAAATPVKVDSAMDYRDRIITVSYNIPTGSDQEPGGVNDYVFDYTPAFRIGYTGRGALDAGAAAPSAGNPPVPASTTSWALQIADERVALRASLDGRAVDLQQHGRRAPAPRPDRDRDRRDRPPPVALRSPSARTAPPSRRPHGSQESTAMPSSFATAAGLDDNNTFTAAQTLAPTAITSGVRVPLTLTGAADTGITASTEQADAFFNGARTLTFATGAITAQRSFKFAAPTLAFAGASTVTTAATVYIDRAPQAGTNATLTNSYALLVGAGTVRLNGSLTIGGAEAASAAVAVTSTTQGFLPPRMTETQRDAIASPAEGLVVYNTTSHKLNVRVAAAWEAITSA